VTQLKVGTIAPTPPPSTKADVRASLAGPTKGVRKTRYTYTEKVTNAGPGVASSVANSMLLPRDASFVSASGRYFRVGQLVVWKPVPRLAANEVHTYSVVVSFASKGTQDVVARATSLRTADPNWWNNFTDATTRIS
jgi:hypothetical protein